MIINEIIELCEEYGENTTLGDLKTWEKFIT